MVEIIVKSHKTNEFDLRIERLVIYPVVQGETVRSASGSQLEL